jgi:DNA-binding SARP family transcriptional activator
VVLNGQADLFNDLGLSLQAAELYGQALTLATRLESKQLIRYGCMQTAVLHRRRGGNTLALEWIKRAIEQSDTGEPNPGETIQMARLEMKASPAQSRNRLLELMDRIGGRLAAEDRTLCLLFAARAAMMEGEIQAAEERMRQALDCAGANGTEQLLVAEFRFDAEAYAFAARRLQGNAVLSVISQRLEVLEGLASSYREPGQARDSSVELAMVGLGQSEVRKDGQPITELTPFSRELLFYLVDHQRVERDTLIETFWPDHLPGRQTSNLHTAVYNVRRAIGKDIIASDGSAYQIDPGYSIAYDVARFERVAAVAEGLPPGDPRKLFALTEAINSYSGPFLMEYASDWVLERRRALEMKYLDLAVSYADEALLRDQPLRAVNTLRQALKIDPYRDDLNLRILEALGRLGRRSEVVSHYQRYVRLLADELGLDPPYAVRDAYARLIG